MRRFGTECRRYWAGGAGLGRPRRDLCFIRWARRRSAPSCAADSARVGGRINPPLLNRPAPDDIRYRLKFPLGPGAREMHPRCTSLSKSAPGIVVFVLAVDILDEDGLVLLGGLLLASIAAGIAGVAVYYAWTNGFDRVEEHAKPMIKGWLGLY